MPLICLRCVPGRRLASPSNWSGARMTEEASLAGVRAGLEGVESERVTVVPGAGHLMGPQLASEVRAAILRHRAEL